MERRWRKQIPTSGAAFEALSAAFKGALVAPSDSAYDLARPTWNGSIDRHPALIAQCADREDIVAAVRFVAETGALVA